MAFTQITKEQAKAEVKRLIDKYNRILESGAIKRYKEEDTKAEFIEPLFEALGWDIRNTENDDEVVREEKISKGRVDYSFRINGIPKFFLEAKALKEDLDNIKFVEQAINYSWHKGCTWAVLTDFEVIKIFNAEWKSANPLQAQFGQSLPCRLFLEKFDALWFLSRESFEKKLLDSEAEKWGKKVKKVSVDKQLLGDLTSFRDLLNKNILKNNASKNLSGDDLDESVQRIIDRLIFIRTLEDKELEAPILQSVIREDLSKRVYKKLNLIFRKIDDVYNSKLFTPHLCENLEIDDDVLTKIINGLFHSSSAVHYDFSAIDADVLGNIYEQYLGHILKKTNKRATLSEGKTHRKEQGIYYTPTYIVDYIVKNTVGELAKDKKFDLKNIKILDPACGSGSFLMKAFDYLVTFDKKKNREADQTKLDTTGVSASYSRKVEILKNNIFGVDLDPKAVEIAQLNLLLKAAEKKERLPTLQENIRVGNSLIDDATIAGNRAFKWESEFKDIMGAGGFDVVIGNPPYIRPHKIPEIDKRYLWKHYKSSSNKTDIYAYFVEKAIELVKDGGKIGLITSNTYFSLQSFNKIRSIILKNCVIEKIINKVPSDAFDAVVNTAVIILRKTSRPNEILRNEIEYFEIEKMNSIKFVLIRKIPQKVFCDDANQAFTFLWDKEYKSLLDKLEIDSQHLGNIFEIRNGLATGDDPVFIKSIKESEVDKPVLYGKDILRYGVNYRKLYVHYNPEKMIKHRKTARPASLDWFEINEKIIIHQVGGSNIKAYLDKESYYATISTIIIRKYPNSLYDLRYVLAILNSSLIKHWYKKQAVTSTVKVSELRRIPMHSVKGNLEQKIYSRLLMLVENIQTIKDKFLQLKDKKTDEKVRLEKEIEKLDSEIDEEVYKLYGITDEEKKIIEDSLK